MYQRTDADEDRLMAAGFIEVDAHWFLNEKSGLLIAMPCSPYFHPSTWDDEWVLWRHDDGDCIPLRMAPSLTEILDLHDAQVAADNHQLTIENTPPSHLNGGEE